MTRSEFDEWLECHKALFETIDTWLERMEFEPRRLILQAWFETLKHTELDAAKAASAKLAADGDTKRQRGSHAQAVRRLAESATATRRAHHRPQYTPDGEEMLRCLDCEDTGMRPVWEQRTLPNGELRVCDAVVLCSCEAAYGCRNNGAIKFNPRLHRRRGKWETAEDGAAAFTGEEVP